MFGFQGLVTKIVDPLHDVAADETNIITLEVTTLNRVDLQSVFWFKDRNPIDTSDRYQIKVSDNGLRPTLTITDLTTDDDGEFSIEIRSGKKRFADVSLQTYGQW